MCQITIRCFWSNINIRESRVISMNELTLIGCLMWAWKEVRLSLFVNAFRFVSVIIELTRVFGVITSATFCRGIELGHQPSLGFCRCCNTKKIVRKHYSNIKILERQLNEKKTRKLHLCLQDAKETRFTHAVPGRHADLFTERSS